MIIIDKLAARFFKIKSVEWFTNMVYNDGGMSTDARKYLEQTVGTLTLGKLLWSIRTSDDYSLDEFAAMLKISKSHLCDIEKGRKFVSLERAAAFAKRLKQMPRQFIRLALQDMVNNAGFNYTVEVQAS